MSTRLTPEFWCGIAVLAFAATVGYEASLIPTSVYARVGPQVVPFAVAGGLGLLGVVLLFQNARGSWNTADDPELTLPVDWRSARWLLLGLALNVSLIADAGFILASALLFACTARCFGSGRPLKDFAAGIVLSAVAYFGFSRGLGINIGAGPIEALF
ncbi:MAG: tripartite tricarboxylate transporter TctB family protein [Rhodospirillales bacterium]|nr:tripartite tricarboxylate transporter TctB family protein [Rhodospirillales bacterium]